MLYPVKVVNIELSRQVPDFENLEGYIALQALIRLPWGCPSVMFRPPHYFG